MHMYASTSRYVKFVYVCDLELKIRVSLTKGTKCLEGVCKALKVFDKMLNSLGCYVD